MAPFFATLSVEVAALNCQSSCSHVSTNFHILAPPCTFTFTIFILFSRQVFCNPTDTVKKLCAIVEKEFLQLYEVSTYVKESSSRWPELSHSKRVVAESRLCAPLDLIVKSCAPRPICLPPHARARAHPTPAAPTSLQHRHRRGHHFHYWYGCSAILTHLITLSRRTQNTHTHARTDTHARTHTCARAHAHTSMQTAFCREGSNHYLIDDVRRYIRARRNESFRHHLGQGKALKPFFIKIIVQLLLEQQEKPFECSACSLRKVLKPFF